MIKVLVVDDSSFMRASVSHILSSDKGIEVAGMAVDGVDALKKVGELRPDVVILDIDMPVMDGLTALSYIMAKYPTPVVMLSGLAEKDARIAIMSLERGAVDFIPKPSGVISYDIDTIRDEIIRKVKIAAEVDVRKMQRGLSLFTGTPPQSPPYQGGDARGGRIGTVPGSGKEIVIIGASTGGPKAVETVLAGIPHNVSAAIIVVQHMSPLFIKSFAERLHWESTLDVAVATGGEVVSPGKVYLASNEGVTAILKEGDDNIISVDRGISPLETSHSIDHTMRSAARRCGNCTLGVLLTGVGEDGAEGMKAIKDAGGATIAEDESTCIVYGMPKAAIEMGVVDEIVPLPGIAEAIMRMV